MTTWGLGGVTDEAVVEVAVVVTFVEEPVDEDGCGAGVLGFAHVLRNPFMANIGGGEDFDEGPPEDETGMAALAQSTLPLDFAGGAVGPLLDIYRSPKRGSTRNDVLLFFSFFFRRSARSRVETKEAVQKRRHAIDNSALVLTCGSRRWTLKKKIKCWNT